MKPLSARWVLGIFLLLMLLSPWLLPPFYLTLLNYIGLYALAALGLVLLTGVGGLTSFGQAAFVGLGAYTTAVLCTSSTLPGWLACPANAAPPAPSAAIARATVKLFIKDAPDGIWGGDVEAAKPKA